MSPIYITVTPHYNLSPGPTVSTDLNRPDPVTFGQHGLQAEMPQTFLPSTSLSPVYTTVTHLHRCHPFIPLSPIYTTVTHLHRCHPYIPLSPIYTAFTHLYHCHPSIPLSPIYTTVTHLHLCHPSTSLSPHTTISLLVPQSPPTLAVLTQ